MYIIVVAYGSYGLGVHDYTYDHSFCLEGNAFLIRLPIMFNINCFFMSFKVLTIIDIVLSMRKVLDWHSGCMREISGNILVHTFFFFSVMENVLFVICITGNRVFNTGTV